MYTIEVLIATMFRKDKDEIIALLGNMNIQTDCVIVNQCDNNSVEYITYDSHKITLINSTERGISRSRNMALKNAHADIVIIADDDIRYVDGYDKLILDVYDMHKEADIISFQVNDKKKYYHKKRKLNIILIHKVISWEITFRRKCIKETEFNIHFGTGSQYFQHGEEHIFLTHCLKNKNAIYYFPLKIAALIEGRPSTWFSGFNKKYFIDHGAAYYQLSHLLAVPYILLFAIRKYRLYKNNLNVFQVIFYMMYGIRKNITVLDKIKKHNL